MNRCTSKIGRKLVKIYSAFVFVSLFYVSFMLIFATTRAEFAGIYLFVLTLPWSLAMTILLDYFRIQDMVPIILKFVLFVLFAAVNASFIYYIGAMFDKTKVQ